MTHRPTKEVAQTPPWTDFTLTVAVPGAPVQAYSALCDALEALVRLGGEYNTETFRYHVGGETLAEGSTETLFPDGYACGVCLDGSVLSDTCDECGTRHCYACDPCEDGQS